MSSTRKPEVEDDTEDWDWVPVAPRANNRRTLAAVLLTTSCLTVGVLIGILWGSAFERASVPLPSTTSDSLKNSPITIKQASKPSLAIGGPSDTATQPQEDASKVPVVINKGLATSQIEPLHPRDGEPREGKTTASENRLTPPRATLTERSVDSKAELPRPGEDLEHENRNVRPPKTPPSENSFKNYRDLRKHVLGR